MGRNQAETCYKEDTVPVLWTFTCGDLLIMMGQRARSEASFYYFRLEDQVPDNYLLS